jgi:hypothetical protein
MVKEQVIIFLNPEDEKVYVKVPAGIPTRFEFQNLAGKLISETVHDKGLHDFDISGLPDGIYFVIVNQNDKISSKKIIKGYHP